ncbi:MAG: hypothetical protein Q7R95_06115 [bacterium]|nr:hypothetical protein [bacterium]
MQITKDTRYYLILNKLQGDEYGTLLENLNDFNSFKISDSTSLICGEQGAEKIYKSLIQGIKNFGKVTVLEFEVGVVGGQVIDEFSRMTVFDK